MGYMEFPRMYTWWENGLNMYDVFYILPKHIPNTQHTYVESPGRTQTLKLYFSTVLANMRNRFESEFP